MQEERLSYLFNKYVENEVSAAEREELLLLVGDDRYNGILNTLVLDVLENAYASEELDAQASRMVLDSIFAAGKKEVDTPVYRMHFLKTAWLRYAAVLLLIAGTVTFLYLHNRPQKEILSKAQDDRKEWADIQPGGNKAKLTLSDGRTIILDSVAIGALATQGGMKIVKTDAGSLAYQGGVAPEDGGYNTVSTPKGGQYQVALPDGSKVWLNAASSIRFPTAFKKERRVLVTGEAYFEITKDKSKPFYIAAADGALVEVLGTSFNISAYEQEPVLTTLVEGSVRVKKESNAVLLRPGQQAVVAARIQLINNADIDQALAWKNGVFNFNKISLEQAMRQIANWYDVDVSYEGTVPSITFGGKMSRELSLKEVFDFMKKMGVRFRWEKERKIVILP